MYFIKLFSFLGKQLLNKRIVYFATMPRYLNQSEAINIDVELFNDYHFKVEQLMELAGLSVASVIQEVYPDVGKVLICVGPGNNGGDGLVAARHLKLFGYSVEIFIPKYPPSNNTLFSALSKQCEFFEIPFLQECPDTNTLTLKYQLIVDALFGFSFKPPVRPEFKNIMESLANSSMTVPVCSIDIPSGWDVEKGPLGQEYLKPETLVSLTAPKLCALHLGQFVKHHFLGGRFIPEKLEKKYSLDLPVYPSSKCYVRL